MMEENHKIVSEEVELVLRYKMLEHRELGFALITASSAVVAMFYRSS